MECANRAHDDLRGARWRQSSNPWSSSQARTSSDCCSKRDFDNSARTLANLYLASLGAELLAENPFADFLDHEAAHIFHTCRGG
jgi:hypothetical protein